MGFWAFLHLPWGEASSSQEPELKPPAAQSIPPILDKNKVAVPPKPFLLRTDNQKHISSLSVTTDKSRNVR